MMPFRAFWPLYLRAHRRRSTRVTHYVATGVGISSAAASIVMMDPIWAILGIANSYALAIAAHRVFEGNRPLITVNPVWGAVADLRMTWLGLTGRLGPELARYGIGEAAGERERTESDAAAVR